MSTTILVSSAKDGSPIWNATISCDGCAVTNDGYGFYTVDVTLTPVSGAFGVFAPDYVPTVVSWWSWFFGSSIVKLDPVPGEGDVGKWG